MIYSGARHTTAYSTDASFVLGAEETVLPAGPGAEGAQMAALSAGGAATGLPLARGRSRPARDVIRLVVDDAGVPDLVPEANAGSWGARRGRALFGGGPASLLLGALRTLRSTPGPDASASHRSSSLRQWKVPT